MYNRTTKQQLEVQEVTTLVAMPRRSKEQQATFVKLMRVSNHEFIHNPSVVS